MAGGSTNDPRLNWHWDARRTDGVCRSAERAECATASVHGATVLSTEAATAAADTNNAERGRSTSATNPDSTGARDQPSITGTASKTRPSKAQQTRTWLDTPSPRAHTYVPNA